MKVTLIGSRHFGATVLENLLEDGIDQRRLTVIDVRNDAYVADMGGHTESLPFGQVWGRAFGDSGTRDKEPGTGNPALVPSP